MKNLRYLLLLCLFALNSLVFAESLADKLGDIVSGSNIEDEILDPEVAFRPSASLNADSFRIEWEIEPGYYLYKQRFAANVVNTVLPLEDIQLPKGKEKHDPAFGDVEVYYHSVIANIPFIATATTADDVQLEITYQGCKEDSVCYPPVKKVFDFNLGEINTVKTDETESLSKQSSKLSAQDEVTQALINKSVLLNVLTFFGFGLLLAFTPCVFPMIPILSGILVGQGSDITRRQAFIMSLAYVLAMALTYALLGVIAASINLNLQIASQQPWVISLFSLVFVLLALSMFGLYEIQLPSALQSSLSSSTNGQAGSIKGAAIMGVVSAVIVGPCVAPPLAGALLYISQTGNILLGGLALFAMGLGFGVPLLILGSSAGSLLPKAGAWMNAIKAIFGVLLLAVAVWFMQRIIPAATGLVLWAVLFIGTSIFLGVFDAAETSIKKLCKALGIIFLVYGIILIIGATSGANSMLRPLAQLNSSSQVNTELPFEKVVSLDDLDNKIAAAQLQGKAVMLDYYADWCVVCNELEAFTFPDLQVHQALSDVVLLKADVTDDNAANKLLLSHFNLFGPPAILFFDAEGKESNQHRLIGFINATDFVDHINDFKQQIY